MAEPKAEDHAKSAMKTPWPYQMCAGPINIYKNLTTFKAHNPFKPHNPHKNIKTEDLHEKQ